MGNNHIFSQNQSQWRRQVIFLHQDPAFSQYLICQDRWGRVLLGREIDLFENSGKDVIIRKLQLRKNQNSSLYPIDGCYFEKINFICSMQQRCILTCLKPKFNLNQIWKTRVNECRGFSWNQIHLVINNISHALRALTNLKQPLYSLNIDNILVNDNVYLMDHLMQNYKHTAKDIFNNYPSPQDLANIQKPHLNYEKDRFSSNLFALGVIGLQLCHPQSNLKQIYQNGRMYESAVKIDHSKLELFVKLVKEPHLQAKLRILTHPIAEQRKTIYNLIEKEKINVKNVSFDEKAPKNIINVDYNICQVKQNEQASPLYSKISVSDKRCCLHSHTEDANQAITRSNRQTNQKSKINIQFVSGKDESSNHNHNMTFNKIPLTINNKENLQNCSNRSKISISQKCSAEKQCISQYTPQRQRKKTQFSTIKQENQSDDCLSSEHPKYCEQLRTSGKFQGLYTDGKKQGWGKFYFKEGSFYEGEWKADSMDGYGKLYYPGGKLAYEGGWTNNQFNGHGTVYNCLPIILQEEFNYLNFNQLMEEWITYEGNLVRDKKQGLGRLTLTNGQYFEGQFVNDKLFGEGTFFTKKGQQIKGLWRNSQLITLL